MRTLPAALAMDRVALLPPGAVGRKPTTTEVDSPPPSVVVPGTPTLNSPGVAPEIWNGVASVTGLDGSSLVMVTALDADAPASREPKSIDGGATLMPGVATPVRATVGAPPRLAIVAVADLPPAVAGWKEIVTVVEEPPASEVVPGVPITKSDGFAPASANGVVSGIVLAAWFVIVIVAFALAPAGSDPKSSEVGDAVIAPVGVLLRFCGLLAALTKKSLALLLVSCVLPLTPPTLRS